MANETSGGELLARAWQRFGPLPHGERKFLKAVPAGETAALGPDASSSPTDDSNPSNAEHWSGDRTLRAELLQWLCVDQAARGQIHPFGIRVTGARIDGHLDLSFMKLTVPLRFNACRFRQGITLTGTELPQLALTGCWVDAIPSSETKDRTIAVNARDVQVTGAVLLNGGFTAIGEAKTQQISVECSIAITGRSRTRVAEP